MIIINQKLIKREDLRANRHVGYLFGDNLANAGYGGQAAEMRGEPNAIGIPTKKSPDNRQESFMTDLEYEDNCRMIDLAFEKVLNYSVLVVPIDGIGTGLAQLRWKAEKTWQYLQGKLKVLGEE